MTDTATTGVGVVLGVMTFCAVAIACLLANLPVGAALIRAAVAGLVLGSVAEVALRLGGFVIGLALADAEESTNQKDE